MEVNVALWGELLLFSHFCRTNHQMETLSLMYMPACRCIIVLRECLRKARSCSCTVNSTYLVWNQNLATCIPNFLQLGLDLSLASFIRPSSWDVSRVSTPGCLCTHLQLEVMFIDDLIEGCPKFAGWHYAYNLVATSDQLLMTYTLMEQCVTVYIKFREISGQKYSFAYLCHLTRKRTLNGIAEYAPKV